jgi:two-component system response regulator
MRTSADGDVLILLVEDNEDHAFLIQKALSGSGLVGEIRVLNTGEKALDYLFRQGEFADPQDSPRPDLILLDIRLPGIDGLEVLQKIKEDKEIRIIPVCMLTTSTQESDVTASYECGVNSYIQKPVDFTKFLDTIKEVGCYWVATNIPPPACS